MQRGKHVSRVAEHRDNFRSGIVFVYLGCRALGSQIPDGRVSSAGCPFRSHKLSEVFGRRWASGSPRGSIPDLFQIRTKEVLLLRRHVYLRMIA